MKYSILIVVFLLVFTLAPFPGLAVDDVNDLNNSHSLTQAQIDSILMLLSAFGVDVDIIKEIKGILRGDVDEPGLPIEKEVPEKMPEEELIISEEDMKINPKPDYDKRDISLMVHNEINKLRQKKGLNPLTWKDDLAEVALKHTHDLVVDNSNVINMDKPCAYPVLRHEGFTFGLGVGDRLINSGISYRVAAENLVLFSGMKNAAFRYDAEDGLDKCEDFSNLDFSTATTEEDKSRLLDKEIEKRSSALNEIGEVNWVNRKWKEAQDIAEEAVVKWFNSPGHRDNMLSADINQGGIGTAIVEGYFIITHVMILR